MAQYIDKSALVAEIEKTEKLSKDKAKNAVDTYFKIHFDGWATACRSILSYLDTLEVEEANEALRTEYEKGRADVIAKACSFLHHYQEYPNHDIATDKLVEAFKMYIEL